MVIGGKWGIAATHEGGKWDGELGGGKNNAVGN